MILYLLWFSTAKSIALEVIAIVVGLISVSNFAKTIDYWCRIRLKTGGCPLIWERAGLFSFISLRK